MIKKIAIALAAVAIALPAAAQKFGVVDANSIFTAMPETTAANNQKIRGRVQETAGRVQ